MRSVKFLALPVLLSTVINAQAATSEWTETPGGKVRVILEDTKSGEEQRGALQITLNPGWKTYWRNPGDAGVPPQITIEGDASAHIDYPAPVYFGASDEGGIGYKQSVSLPLTFTSKPGDDRLKGNVFLGVCDKICIPVQAQFDFPLSEATDQSPQAIATRTIIETAFDRLPAPASADFGVKSVKRIDNKAVFELALPDQTTPAEFFIGSEQLNLSVPKPEGQSQFSAMLHGEAKKGAEIDYTLVQNGKAVSGQIQLD
ncbi:protein-disulfide reductase DsbD domain-containing protein [Brucella sp. H1_1004]|uniref:protein-disulfide reductase DsbD domain-containing protein n=1 Tax=Brucella sp. H1_1004 TaxID=3110109 RepID=UPI0039B59166